MRRLPLAVLAPVLLMLAGPAAALGDPAEQLADPAQEGRAREIGRELRCMVCQNQSIEDSDADLARDLRRIVREQVAAGRSDRQVIDYLHDRYGDFVLLRPPLSPATALLWGTPLLALLVGGAMLWSSRRHRPTAPGALSEEERRRLAEIEAEPRA